jgi:hypothetical protein
VAHLIAEVDPAIDMEDFLIEGASLNATGKFTPNGVPKTLGALLQAAEFTRRYRESAVLCFPPPLVQRILFPPLAALQRRRAGQRPS